LNILKAALNLALKRKAVALLDPCWRHVEPFRNTEKGRDRFLTEMEATLLVNCCEGDFRDLFQAALLTGCRYGELARLRTVDFDAKNASLHIRESKSGRPRHVPLTALGVKFFKSIRARVEHGALMFTKGGKPWEGNDNAYYMQKALKKAGLDGQGICFHTARHSYASTLITAGVPLAYVAKALGHTTLKMVEKHYGHLAESDFAKAIRENLPDFGIEVDGKFQMLNVG
jgi:integrase